MNWEPIDTAPKDGRPIWVRGNNYNDPERGQHCAWVYWDGDAWSGPLHDEDEPKFEHLTEWLAPDKKGKR